MTNPQNTDIIFEYSDWYAGMAELADAHGSGPCESNFMQVQVLLPASCPDTDCVGAKIL